MRHSFRMRFLILLIVVVIFLSDVHSLSRKYKDGITKYNIDESPRRPKAKSQFTSSTSIEEIEKYVQQMWKTTVFEDLKANLTVTPLNEKSSTKLQEISKYLSNKEYYLKIQTDGSFFFTNPFIFMTILKIINESDLIEFVKEEALLVVKEPTPRIVLDLFLVPVEFITGEVKVYSTPAYHPGNYFCEEIDTTSRNSVHHPATSSGLKFISVYENDPFAYY